jgi:antitoxin (DNA-binding transcriptional repressor) of toxin-antitoxin stability system
MRIFGWSDLSKRVDQRTCSRQVRSERHVELAQYNTYAARALFSDLLRRVRNGEEILIAHAGQPVAKLVPYAGAPGCPGIVRARITIDSDLSPSEE